MSRLVLIWFSVAALASGQVTPGAHFEFDANIAATQAAWTNTGANSFENFSSGPFAGAPGAVSDATFLGVVAAHDTSSLAVADAAGAANAYESAGGNASTGSATFEFWARVDDTATDQILAEFGGSGRGTLFAISDGEVEFFMNGEAEAGVSAAITTGWHQIAGTYTDASGAMELFIDGTSVATGGVAGINDWAGGNQAGLGNRGSGSHCSGSATFGATFDADAPFQGLISVYRLYRSVLSDDEIEDNYDAMFVAPPPPAVVVWAGSLGDWNSVVGDRGSGDTVGVGAATDGTGRVVSFDGAPAVETIASLLLGHDNANEGHGTLVVESGELVITGDLIAGRSTGANDGFLDVRGGTVSVGGDAQFGIEADTADGNLIISGGAFAVAGDLWLGDFLTSGSFLRFHNPGSSPAVDVGGQLRLGRCSLSLSFDEGYTHDPAGGDLVLVTYASRDAQFLNARRGEIFTAGPNRFRVNYDVDLGGGSLAITLTPLPNHSASNGPNVVLIFVDDQGFRDLSMQGDASFPTPEIDALAASGARFTDFYVSASVCHPSRCGLITGRHGQRFGTDGNLGNPDSAAYNGLAPSQRTVPRRLQSIGYRTYGIGKWHLGETAEFHPLQRGFNRWYGMDAGSRSYDGPNYNSEFSEKQVFQADEVPVPGDEGDYLTDRIGDKAVEFIGEHVAGGSGEPFFLYVSFTAVHGPMHWMEDRFQRLENEFGIDIHPDARDLTTQERQLPSEARRDILRAMTLALDENVGKIMAKLADPDGDPETEDGILSDTLVVYTNDNGGSEDDSPPIGGDNASNNFPLRGQKGGLWEGGIRVPAALAWPGTIPAGQTISEPVTSLDVMATFVNAGGDAPSEARNGLDGLDLIPLLRDGTPLPDERALCWRRRGPAESTSVIRKGDWKLLISDSSQTYSLYNLASDIGESNNLAATEGDKVDELLEDFLVWESQMLTPFYNGTGVEFDSGLERQAASDGYRLLTRDAADRWMTSVFRTPIDTGSDFTRSIYLRPTETPAAAGQRMWLGLGESRDTGNFLRVGVDLGAGQLLIEEGKSAGNSVAETLDPGDIPTDFVRLDLSFRASTSTIRATLGATTAQLVLNASYGPLDVFGYGVAAMEAEFSPAFDPSLAGGVESSIHPVGTDELVIEAVYRGNAVFPPSPECSTDLLLFEPDPEALIEHLGAGRYRMTSRIDEALAQEFFRIRFNQPRSNPSP